MDQIACQDRGVFGAEEALDENAEGGTRAFRQHAAQVAYAVGCFGLLLPLLELSVTVPYLKLGLTGAPTSVACSSTTEVLHCRRRTLEREQALMRRHFSGMAPTSDVIQRYAFEYRLFLIDSENC